MNARAIAAQAVRQVIQDGRSLSEALLHCQKSDDIGLVKELGFGVLRWYFRLNLIAKTLLSHPLKEKDSDVHALVLIGLYQILFMRVPDHAAVAETVNACRDLKKPWASKLINAVLRRFLREQEQLLTNLSTNEIYQTAHPVWLLGKLKKAWPEHWQAIIEENNQHPPLTLRINQSQTTTPEFFQQLDQAEIGYQDLVQNTVSVILDKPLPVEKIPRFAQGHVSVQDASAQLAAPLLQLKKGQRVLDACAAPGGKTAHILEIQPDLAELFALDIDETRLEKIKDNLDRLKLNQAITQLICADAGHPTTWWDKKPFDRILLDAPCSASGVIRRHPDIKLLRQPDDVKKLPPVQLGLLTALWPCLKPGGLLLYATCSVFPAENTGVIASFLNANKDAQEQAININGAITCQYGTQILPSKHYDGFYYCLLRKDANQ